MTKVVVIDPDELRAIVRDELGRFGKQLHGAGRQLRPGGNLMSTTDAARFAGVAPGTIRAWVDAGKLGRYQAGRVLRVSQTELEALLAGETENAATSRTPEQEADLALRRRQKAQRPGRREDDDEGGT